MCRTLSACWLSVLVALLVRKYDFLPSSFVSLSNHVKLGLLFKDSHQYKWKILETSRCHAETACWLQHLHFLVCSQSEFGQMQHRRVVDSETKVWAELTIYSYKVISTAAMILGGGQLRRVELSSASIFLHPTTLVWGKNRLPRDKNKCLRHVKVCQK